MLLAGGVLDCVGITGNPKSIGLTVGDDSPGNPCGDFCFDRKMRIAPYARYSISSARAQDNRADYPLLRNTRSTHQHLKPRRLAEPGANVVGMVAGLELHARPGPDGPHLRQPHPHLRVCD